MSTYKIHVSKDNMIFAAGHFVIYDGDQAEPLHGHNYRLSVALEGALDENAYVFNFVPLKKAMKRIADELDHRMLLPGQSQIVRVEQADGGVVARVGAKWYRFPAEDVVILPVPNTTVEMLATYLCGRFRALLLVRPDAAHLTAIEVSVEETFGQHAVYREDLSA